MRHIFRICFMAASAVTVSFFSFSVFATSEAVSERGGEAGPLPVAGAPRTPESGDCVEFREEGAGQVLKTPSYWVRGRVVESYRVPHRIGPCPDADKPRGRYGREEWKRLAAAYPCVQEWNAPIGEEREITVLRVRLAVTAWETPWTRNHGQNGWLYRGHFLDTPLKEDIVLDVDASLLSYCTGR